MNAGLMADLPSLETSGRRGRRPVPHRIAVPDPQPDAETVRIGGAVQTCSRLRPMRQARGVPHAGYRVGQGSALHETCRRAQPGAGLARHSRWAWTSAA